MTSSSMQFEGGLGLFQCVDLHLSLAVIAQGGGLQQQRRCEFRAGVLQIAGIVDGDERCGGKVVFPEKGFFADAILGDAHRVGIRPHRAEPVEVFQAVGRDVLELGGDGRAFVTQHLQGGVVRIPGLQMLPCYTSGRTVRIRIEHDHVIAHAVCGQCEHAAQLAAAQYTQCRAGQDHVCGGSCISRTLVSRSLR